MKCPHCGAEFVMDRCEATAPDSPGVQCGLPKGHRGMHGNSSRQRCWDDPPPAEPAVQTHYQPRTFMERELGRTIGFENAEIRRLNAEIDRLKAEVDQARGDNPPTPAPIHTSGYVQEVKRKR